VRYGVCECGREAARVAEGRAASVADAGRAPGPLWIAVTWSPPLPVAEEAKRRRGEEAKKG
jgi:hypothetical protein